MVTSFDFRTELSRDSDLRREDSLDGIDFFNIPTRFESYRPNSSESLLELIFELFVYLGSFTILSLCVSVKTLFSFATIFL